MPITSHYDYWRALELRSANEPFYSLVMAAMLRADTGNHRLLCAAFPLVAGELNSRYHAGGGLIAGDPGYDEVRTIRAELLSDPESDSAA